MASEKKQGRVAGKIAIVTGGAKGIGAAQVELLAREGASVVASDVDVENGRNLAERLNREYGNVIFQQHDVTSESSWAGLVQRTLDTYGRIDVLVNNAGIIVSGPITALAAEDLDRLLAVNVKGVIFGCKHVAPAMARTGGGAIVNLSSSTTFAAVPNIAAYVATKGAVQAFTRAAALDFAPLKIRVNSVHPGFTPTPMTADMAAEVDFVKIITEPFLPGRLPEPKEIAAAMLFLASDEASYVNGHSMVVDGGNAVR